MAPPAGLNDIKHVQIKSTSTTEKFKNLSSSSFLFLHSILFKWKSISPSMFGTSVVSKQATTCHSASAIYVINSNFQSINVAFSSLLLYSSVKQKRYNIKLLQRGKAQLAADFTVNPYLFSFPSKNMRL